MHVILGRNIHIDISSKNMYPTEANRRRGLGTREKASSRRINLESNTYVHGSKTRNLPVQLSFPQLAKTPGPPC
jgi:hypothetical protein